MYSNPLLWKKTKMVTGGRFFSTFLSILNTLVKKILIINSHHPFLVSLHVFKSSVAFDANYLRPFLFIPSKILRKLSLPVFGGNVAIWANNKVSVVSNLVGSWIYRFFTFSPLSHCFGRSHCFHDNIYIVLILLLWDLNTLCV